VCCKSQKSTTVLFYHFKQILQAMARRLSRKYHGVGIKEPNMAIVQVFIAQAAINSIAYA
jgi:hypothetical protein